MSAFVLPALIVALLVYALCRRVDVYGAFVAGAKEGLTVLVGILPYLAAMLVALNAFRACGAMGALMNLLAPLCSALGLPEELVPLAVLKPFSGSASLGVVADLLKEYGPDSFVGFCACIMMGSSETIFYTISLYFGSVGITKSRYALPVALLSGLAGIAASVIAAHWFWPYD